MNADIRQTKIIHFPEEDISKVIAYRPDETKLRVSIGIDIFSVYKETILPIVVAGHVKILKEDIVLFSCILHTKVLLTFDFDEKPVEQLMAMLETVQDQEKKEWQAKVKGTYFEPLNFEKMPTNSDVNFNKAYQLIEAARKHQVVSVNIGSPENIVSMSASVSSSKISGKIVSVAI